MGELPVEIIYDILPRLPVKSLARFRCVCKDWCKYIDEPNLASIHRAIEEPMPVLLTLHRDPAPDLLTLIGSKQGDVKEDSVLSFECMEQFAGYRGLTIKGSCNGLLYLSRYSDIIETTLSVIHPLRKERYELPPILSMTSCGLGFDSSTNTFKMCATVYEEKWKTVHAMVHVLGTDSWREIPQIPYYPMMSPGIFAHGCLHWLAVRVNKVIHFDIRKEEFGVIDPPRKDQTACTLVDLLGEVGIVYTSLHPYSKELWVLRQNQWVIYCQFDVKPPLPEYMVIKIIGLWNNSGDILVAAYSPGPYPLQEFFIYSLKSGGFNQVNLVSSEDIHMYRSSLFSIRALKKSAFLSSNLTSFNFGSSRKRRRNGRKIRIPSKTIFRFLKFC